ncbi:hypothetical protein FNV43_RR00720 [Rhamnella rubrinervis]|uniref:Sesquiterpene synthase n=1 Tax=Rhamnella rubrinervis TaxID=2594499 RepID=A0A8K0HNC9_9ROSA|nr:hypothetical protein FNV43_RR00720 [Rhamnella rubrinervis]
MPIEVSSAQANSSNGSSTQVTRRSANFHPSLWGDYFLKYASQSRQEVDIINLEQQADIFHKFTNKEGKFKEELVNDVEGMLSLYEAAHWRVQGEHILEEALSFTTTQLPHEDGLRGLSKTLHFYLSHPASLSDDQILLTFAKLDFNILQKCTERTFDISRWWKDLDFASKLPFAEAVVECYFWITGVYFEPQYALARRIVTKVMAVTSSLMIYMMFMQHLMNSSLHQAIERIVKASSTICRLMDDVVDHKEHNKGHGDSASGVECYMNKHGV